MTGIAITELPPFTKKVAKILNEEELETLRSYLIQHPDKGDVIPGTGGIRKLRWAAGGKGKRGGARVIYFYHVVGSTIYLMACYTKNEQADISPSVKKQLKAIVDQIKKGA
jgi:mRNA-degrading endonuclease RelE of RelBE toxin-antitoxin system